MFIENYQSGDALSTSLDSRLNASSYCGNCTSYLRHEFVSMGDGELTPAYFMLELRLVFSAFNSHL